MISTTYPVSGSDFVNRREIMDNLLYAFNYKQSVALVGQRRIGKSSIAIELCRRIKKMNKNTVPIYFKVHQNIGSPGRFGMRLLIEIISEYLKILDKNTVNLIDLELKPSNLIDISQTIESDVLMELSKFLISNFPPDSKNERTIFVKIMQFIEDFATELDIEFVLALDEFQDIKELENYPSIGKDNILAILEGIISTQKHIWYILTGSMIRLMTDILEDGRSPLYGRFKKISVKGFDKEDMIILVNKVCENAITGDALNLLWQITNGHPYYIIVISKQANFLTKNEIITKKHIEEAFLTSLTDGELNSHCNYIFDTSLGMSSKATMLKDIIKHISEYENITLTEIAKYMGRDRGNISPLMRMLLNFDLIGKYNKTYRIQDGILTTWLKNIYGYNEPQLGKIKKDLGRNYLELISKLKEDRGILFESHVRELFRRFDNTKHKKRVLPKFNTVADWNIYDDKGLVFNKPSIVNIDILCQSKTQNWIAEIKYKGGLITKKDLELLLRQKKLVEEKTDIHINLLCYISISGFKENTLQFAKDNKIWCIDRKVLDSLTKRYRMRVISNL